MDAAYLVLDIVRFVTANTRLQGINNMKIFDIRWSTKTAGPSPDSNNRTELFLFGCKKAKEGNPCKGCFNPSTWDDSIATKLYSPDEVAKQIAANAPNKYITVGGGEPLDQIDELIVLCNKLSKLNFHIMVYTHYKLEYLINDIRTMSKTWELLYNIHMLVDGEYESNERLYIEDAQDGLLNSIGSGNQYVWDLSVYKTMGQITGYKMKEIKSLKVKDDYSLEFNLI